MLGFQKFDIFTRGDPCAGISKINIFTRGDPCVGISKTGNFIREYPYIPLKYHFKNVEKEGGVICKGGVICSELN